MHKTKKEYKKKETLWIVARWCNAFERNSAILGYSNKMCFNKQYNPVFSLESSRSMSSKHERTIWHENFLPDQPNLPL